MQKVSQKTDAHPPILSHTTPTSQYDTFVAKFEPISGSLVWNTFLGDDLNGSGVGITANSNGAYVTGYAKFQGSTPAQAFVAGLDTNGSQSWYVTIGNSTYNDAGRDIAVDAIGDIYVTGDSWGEWGSPRHVFSGAEDAFVIKLDNDGNTQWNTFVGGAGWDMGYGIDVDDFGNIFLSGYSTAIWGIPFDSGTGNPQSVFAAKLDYDGDLQWNTFIIGTAAYATSGHHNRIAVLNGSAYVNSIVYDSNGVKTAYVTKINGLLCAGSDSPPSSVAYAVAAEVGEQAYCGNQYDGIITLPPGQDAFVKFRDLAKTAEYEVDFVTMIWDSFDDEEGDSPGRIFLQGIKELFERVKANPPGHPVRVRILLGLKYHGIQDQRVSVMNDLAGLQIDRDRPDLGWKVEVASYREGIPIHSHVKMIIVDGTHVIAAGYNMQYSYLEPNPEHDMGIQANGPIASNTLQVFDSLWMGAHFCELPDFITDTCLSDSTITVPIEHDMPAPSVTGDDIVFSLFRNDTNKTADNAIAAAIGAAGNEVNVLQNRFLYNRYYLLEYQFAVLNALLKEDALVAVKILASGDSKNVRLNTKSLCAFREWAYEEMDIRPLSLLVKLSSKTNPIHTKALSIDNTFIIVGSQNFDGSAWGDNNLDFDLAEYSLGVDSVEAAGHFNTIFETEWNAAVTPSCLSRDLTGSALQNAIDQASPGTPIVIPAGVYTASVTINKPLTLIGAGPDQTIIQPVGNQPAFRITSSDVTISNMKISGGAGHGIELINSSPSGLENIEINRVVFANNAAGGVLAQSLISGSPMNYAIENNTFIGGTGGITINMVGTQADTSFIRNNIFFGQSAAPVRILSTNDGRVEYTYNLFDDCGGGACAANWHVGNLSAVSSAHDNLFDLNPLFANPGNGAYQLSTGSPAIDAGDPSLLHDLYLDGNNDGIVRIDIGAFEFALVTNVSPVVNAGSDQNAATWSPFTFTATYSDSDNLENHSARIDWGDGTVQDVPTSMTGPGSGDVIGQHTYSAPGIYTVRVCVIDQYGSLGCDTIMVEVLYAPPNGGRR